MSRFPGVDVGPHEAQAKRQAEQIETAQKMDAENQARARSLDEKIRVFRGDLMRCCPDSAHLSRALRLLNEVENEAFYALRDKPEPSFGEWAGQTASADCADESPAVQGQGALDPRLRQTTRRR